MSEAKIMELEVRIEVLEKEIRELEVRIEVFEKEIRELKETVEVLKATKVTDTSTTESVAIAEAKKNVKAKDVLATPIEELNLSARAFDLLKRFGINSLGDLAIMSEEELRHIRHLGRKFYDELTEKIGNLLLEPEVAQKRNLELKRAEAERKVKEEPKRQLALKLSENFAVALQLYAKIEEQASREGIRWNHLKSRFHRKFRKFKSGKSFTVAKETISGTPLLETYDCGFFLSGQYPKIQELLTVDKEKITTEMCKEAILEDFRESNKEKNPTTKTYQQALRFIEIIKNFKE